MANTALPVTKRVAMNFRWGVCFPGELGKQLPILSVNKIGLERIDEVKEVKEKGKEGNVGEVEMLKGMCTWMRRELDVLQKENREMKHTLEEMKIDHLGRNGYGYSNVVVGKKLPPSVENSTGFEQWKSKKNGGEGTGNKESKKNGNRSSDVESELQRAIKAASS